MHRLCPTKGKKTPWTESRKTNLAMLGLLIFQDKEEIRCHMFRNIFAHTYLHKQMFMCLEKYLQVKRGHGCQCSNQWMLWIQESSRPSIEQQKNGSMLRICIPSGLSRLSPWNKPLLEAKQVHVLITAQKIHLKIPK